MDRHYGRPKTLRCLGVRLGCEGASSRYSNVPRDPGVLLSKGLACGATLFQLFDLQSRMARPSESPTGNVEMPDHDHARL